MEFQWKHSRKAAAFDGIPVEAQQK
eukprot:SAG22_NODE_17264_length_308_cov_0.966507_1_plen_24_part_10